MCKIGSYDTYPFSQMWVESTNVINVLWQIFATHPTIWSLWSHKTTVLTYLRCFLMQWMSFMVIPQHNWYSLLNLLNNQYISWLSPSRSCTNKKNFSKRSKFKRLHLIHDESHSNSKHNSVFRWKFSFLCQSTK